MFTGTYKLADRVIEVHSLYERVHRLCRGYETDGSADFTVTVTPADIEFENARELQCAEREGRPSLNPPDDYFEELAVYRKIAEKMPDYDTILFHGSAIAVDGQCYLFTAKSGTGKSTHTRLWRQLLGARAVMVNDDKPLLRVSETGVTVYGTPYNGKHRLGENIAVPLKAVCILERAAENRIERISREDAFSMLIQQTFRPRDPVQTAKTIALTDRLSQLAALYRLGCNMELSAAETAYNAMKG